MSSAKDKFDSCETIMRILDGTVTEAAFRVFEKQLNESEDIRLLYMGVLESYAHMQKPGSLFGMNAMADSDDTGFRPDLWRSLAKMEKDAPAIPVEKEAPQPQPLLPVVPERVHRPYQKASLIAAISAAAAVLLLIVYAHMVPVQDRYYGQITDMHQAVFADSGRTPQRGEFLGEELTKLQKGLVRIQMDDGSIVHVEAPAEFRLEGEDQLFLMRGKLTASVPESAIGFTVRTPSASIVDYGTEFGVSIDPYAGTQAHVLKGCVEMRLGSNMRVFEQALRLIANQAGCASGQTLSRIPARLSEFTYELPSAFETAARQLNPQLYFRLKNGEIHSFCEAVAGNALDIRTGSRTAVTAGPELGDCGAYALQLDDAGVEIHNVLPVFRGGSGNFTVACWVRFDEIRGQVVWANRVVAENNPASAYDRILWMNDQGQLEHTAYFPEYAEGSRRVNSVRASEALEPNRWYWVAVTHAVGKHKFLYINGRPAARSGGVQSMTLEKYSGLALGRPVDTLAPGLAGAVSEILFFNRDLSDREIQTLYEAALKK